MITINDYEISSKSPPYIVAEISANHNGSLLRAKEHIRQAKKSGANAVKIQTYRAETMTLDCDKEDFLIKGGIWDGNKLYDLYKEAHTPYAWHRELFEYSKEIGITIFSSPFDEKAVDLLEELNTPAYKIASFELCDIPLIKYIAKKNKPMLMSTGMASKDEIDEAVNAAKSSGCNQILLFHCVSSYPTKLEDANLKNIIYLKNKYDIEVGLSDHTLGNEAAVASIALGASAVEKHFTLSRNDIGPDSSFSIEPSELKDLITKTKSVWYALGQRGLGRSESELKNRKFRRSIYFSADIKSGGTINEKNIKRIRPGLGLPPKYYDDLIGKKLKKDVERGDPVSWEVIDLN